MVVACGGDPPEKELQQAEAAIAEAVDVSAEQYAADELNAARQAMANARAAVTARDFRLALNHALDARDRARTAVSLAVSAAATAKSNADMAIGEAVTAIDGAKAKLTAAETAKAAARSVAGHRETITHAETRLQEARTAWAKGDYSTATTAAKEASAGIRSVSEEIDALLPTTRRRR